MSELQLLTTKAAAELLGVSSQTVLNWIAKEAIPYIQLPAVGDRREYRIPLKGLLESLGGNYNLGSEVEIPDVDEESAKIKE